jgi:uncharacterized repeat protein (TIGR03803 family)
MNRTISFLTLCLLIIFVSIDSFAQGHLWGVTAGGGSNDQGVMFRTAPDGTNYNVHHQFKSIYTGTKPATNNLIQGSNGKLYGTTPYGGNSNMGVFYEYDPASGVYKKLYEWSNQGPFIQRPMGVVEASPGKFYGITDGGSAGHHTGVIFKFDLATSTYTNIHVFDNTLGGAYPQEHLTLGSNGKIYGTTPNGGAENGMGPSRGTLFEIDPATDTFTKKIDFSQYSLDWSQHNRLVATSNGKLYGLANSVSSGQPDQSALIEYTISTNTVAIRYLFPTVPLVLPATGSICLSSDQTKIYGLEATGIGSRAMYEYNLSTSTYTRKHNFNPDDISGSSGFIMGSNGKLYTSTYNWSTSINYGKIAEYDFTTGTLTNSGTFSQGFSMPASVIQGSDGMLYGINQDLSSVGTSIGGIFRYNPSTTQLTKVFAFVHTSNGKYPRSGLAKRSDGRIFGITAEGGDETSMETTGSIYSFDPSIPTTFAPGNYGFISAGFSSNKAISSATQGYGAYPIGVPTLAGDNKFYFLSSQGGVYGYGAIVQYSLTFNGTAITGSLSGRYQFPAKHAVEGAQTGLTLAPNGKLYGVTSADGTNGNGTIFEYAVSGGYSLKQSFNSSVNGSAPYAEMILASNGKLYGTTYQGGTNNQGVIFSYDYINNTLTKVFDFSTTTGTNPRGRLLQASNGKIYGTTSAGGTNGVGTIFEFDITTLTFTKRLDFLSSASGANPYGGLIQAPNGKLYGSAYNGGANGMGVLFEFDPITLTYVKRLDFNGANGKNPAGTLFYDATNSKTTQTITFNPLPPKTPADPPYALTATASSGLPISYTSSTTSVATVSGNTVTLVGQGTTYFTASQGGDATYFPATNVSQAQVVAKANQTISFAALVPKTTTDPPFLLTATATSGLPVSYTSSNTSVATISGNTLTIVGFGATTITAVQAGNMSFNAAPNVQQSLSVGKTGQTINFGPLTSKCPGTSFSLAATATSGLPVSYTSSNSSIATISGSTVTVIASGTINITANQAGNAIYAAAPPVTQPLVVIAKPVASITPSGSTNFCQGSSIVLTANPGDAGNTYLWSTGATTRTITVSTAGTFSVVVTNTTGCSSNSVSVTTTIKSTPAVYIAATYDLCTNGYTRLTATNVTGATSYSWSTGSTASFINVYSAGTRTVTVTFSNGCTRTASYTVGVCAPPPDPCDPPVEATAARGTPCEEQITLKKEKELFLDQTSVYPNRANESMTISIPQPAKSELKVFVYSQFGQVVFSGKISSNSDNLFIETGSLSNGMYMVHVEVPGGKKNEVVNRKVMIQH